MKWLTILVCMLTVVGCQHKEREASVAREITSFAERHAAVTDWRTLLPSQARQRESGIAYSIEVDQAISAHGDTAILFVATLMDVTHSDSGFTAVFNTVEIQYAMMSKEDHSPYPSDLELRCDRKTADYLLSKSIGLFGAFALVVQLTDADCYGLHVQAYEDYDPSYDVTPITFWSGWVTLKGELIEALHVDDYQSLGRFFGELP